MPNFSDEMIERMRRERVHQTEAPTSGDPRIHRVVLDEDMEEERQRLKDAEAQIRVSRANLVTLAKKSDALRKRYGV